MTFSYAGIMFFEMACELCRFLFLNCMFIDSYVTLVVPSTARDRIEEVNKKFSFGFAKGVGEYFHSNQTGATPNPPV